MSLENIVIAVSLLLGIVLLILIIYLISRVNDLEAKAFSIQGTTNSAEKKSENESLSLGLVTITTTSHNRKSQISIE